MSNLFDGAKIGDKFKKNDGEMAVYVSYDANYHIHSLYDEKYSILVNDDGTSIHTNWIDIVSRWEEPNNEKLVNEEKTDDELQSIANEEIQNHDLNYFQDEDDIWKSGFVSGYKKAKEE